MYTFIHSAEFDEFFRDERESDPEDSKFDPPNSNPNRLRRRQKSPNFLGQIQAILHILDNFACGAVNLTLLPYIAATVNFRSDQ